MKTETEHDDWKHCTAIYGVSERTHNTVAMIVASVESASEHAATLNPWQPTPDDGGGE